MGASRIRVGDGTFFVEVDRHAIACLFWTLRQRAGNSMGLILEARSSTHFFSNLLGRSQSVAVDAFTRSNGSDFILRDCHFLRSGDDEDIESSTETSALQSLHRDSGFVL